MIKYAHSSAPDTSTSSTPPVSACSPVKHLQHARDLSDWTIEEVAPDRFLLSASDLEPWYAGTAAPPEIVEKARADFGDMILTWDTILANPGPYTSTHPSVVGR